MFGSQVLDIGIGLVLIFMLISLILTSFQEALEGILKSRGRNLEKSLFELFQRDSALLQKFYDHPLVFALYRQDYSGLGGWSRQLPSYIPRDIFAAALLQLRAAGELASQPKLEALVESIETMTGADTDRVRRELERWYDGAMDRASGHYKRHTQLILFVSALVAAVVMNLNAVVIGQYLSVSTTARDQIVAVAERTRGPAPAAPVEPDARQLYSDLAGLKLPIGWGREARVHVDQALGTTDPRGSEFLVAAGNWATFVAGYLITALAAMLGAPFWFDVLNRLMVIRSTVKPREKSPDEPSNDGGPPRDERTEPAMPSARTPPPPVSAPPDPQDAADADATAPIYG